MNSKKMILAIPAFLLFGALTGCAPQGIDTNWINKDNWYELTSNATVKDIGKTVTVKVNNQNHIVRLIDIDHDVDENGNKLHTTWEFANLISDKDGHSLAYQYNDINVDDEEVGYTANYDYVNSTIRYALNGQGNNGKKQYNPHLKGLVLVAQKDKTKFSTSAYDKPIFTMLPEGLQSKIKTVRKSVGVRSKTVTDYVETKYTDKLFMLSSKEMGNNSTLYDDKGFGTIYTYYKINPYTVKSQVKNEVNYAHGVLINDSAQSYHESIYNFAGQHEGMFTKFGGSYWLRSPYSNLSRTGDGAFCCDETGTFGCHEGYNHALGIAPAFCI